MAEEREFEEILADAKDLGIDGVEGIEVLEPGFSMDRALDQLELEEYEIAEQNATLRREESEKFDLEAEVERILSRKALPAGYQLPALDLEGGDAFGPREAEFEGVRADRVASEPVRVLRGVAFLLCNSEEKDSDGLGTATQFQADAEQLSHVLPKLGFEDVQIKHNLTRNELIRELRELAVALGEGGNLAWAQGLFLFVAATGTPVAIDCARDQARQPRGIQDSPVTLWEVLHSLRDALPGLPKVVVLSLCSAIESRYPANVEVHLQPSACEAAAYQQAVEEIAGMILVVCVAKGQVNWVPKGGSIFVRFVIEALKLGAMERNVAALFAGVDNQMRAHIVSRKGLGPPDCPVGIEAYHNTFLQRPLIAAAPGADKTMLGPCLKFSEQHAKVPFTFSEVNSRLDKSAPASMPIHAASVPLPSLISSRPLSQLPRIAWEFEIHSLEGSMEVYVGAVTAAEKEEHFRTDRMTDTSAVPGLGKKRGGQKEAEGPRKPVLGKGFGWSVSADGGIYPDAQARKHGGYRAGSRVTWWVDRAEQRMEVLVDGKHTRVVFKDVPEEGDLVPAVTMGALCNCSVSLSRLWAW